MIGLAIPALLFLLAVVLVVVIAIQRSMRRGPEKGDGSDIVAYLVMAVAMGVTGFSLAELANTAFPGDRFVFDPAENLATSLAGLVVSAPFLIYFWIRQSRRRSTYPAAAGWTLYLSLMELVFMTAFVITAVLFVNGLLTEATASAWTGTVVFGLIVLFHEFSAKRNPPMSDAAELPRVIGSAIGLIATAIGLAGVLSAAFVAIFDVTGGGPGFHPWTAMLIVGLPVWAYRWLRGWDANEPSAPRLVWATGVSIAALATSIGAAASLVVMSLQYVLGDTPPAGQHFGAAPEALGLLLTGVPIFVVHRRALGTERTNPVRALEYAMAAVGLLGAVSGAVALTVIAFDRDLLVGGGIEDTITFATTLVVGLVVWWYFTRRSERQDAGTEMTSWPRRFYHLGLGVIFGLVAAGALITTLFVLFRRVFAGVADTSLVTPASLFLYAGITTWYLLAAYARDRTHVADEAVIVPFDVTIVTSHPGMIAAMFPKQARLQVIHRGDGVGAIDDETAGAIVEAVANRSSVVWVDEDGFRVAPRLETS